MSAVGGIAIMPKRRAEASKNEIVWPVEGAAKRQSGSFPRWKMEEQLWHQGKCVSRDTLLAERNARDIKNPSPQSETGVHWSSAGLKCNRSTEGSVLSHDLRLELQIGNGGLTNRRRIGRHESEADRLRFDELLWGQRR